MNREKIAQDIAHIRETGLVNMFDRLGVIEVLEACGKNESAEYLMENKDKYMELLILSGEF